MPKGTKLVNACKRIKRSKQHKYKHRPYTFKCCISQMRNMYAISSNLSYPVMLSISIISICSRQSVTYTPLSIKPFKNGINILQKSEEKEKSTMNLPIKSELFSKLMNRPEKGYHLKRRKRKTYHIHLV